MLLDCNEAGVVLGGVGIFNVWLEVSQRSGLCESCCAQEFKVKPNLETPGLIDP